MSKKSNTPTSSWLPPQLHSLLLTQDWFIPIAALVLLGDAALTALIVLKVPYTEIDYSTYMQQAGLFLKGQRNYALITGDTGPCVYPAGHLYVYSVLHRLTDAGRDLRLAQWIFAALYLVCQAAVVEVYRKAGAPSLLLAFLPLSKRLHSIYALRLFNDGVAMTVMWVAIALVAHRRYSAACVVTSLALSVKMNILLFVPGLAVVVWRAKGAVRGAVDGLLIVLVQVLVSLPFLTSPYPVTYLRQAFDLSRQFLYKWTVNLRFLPEDVFLARSTGTVLLAAHAALLLVFGLTRWTGIGSQGQAWIAKTWRGGDEMSSRGEMADACSQARTGADLQLLRPVAAIMTLLTSNLIGILCARSLHYQFYAWYAQSLLLLVWQSHMPASAKLLVPLSIEIAWNVFPSTISSSASLCASNALLLLGLYRSQAPPSPSQPPRAKVQ